MIIIYHSSIARMFGRLIFFWNLVVVCRAMQPDTIYPLQFSEHGFLYIRRFGVSFEFIDAYLTALRLNPFSIVRAQQPNALSLILDSTEELFHSQFCSPGTNFQVAFRGNVLQGGLNSTGPSPIAINNAVIDVGFRNGYVLEVPNYFFEGIVQIFDSNGAIEDPNDLDRYSPCVDDQGYSQLPTIDIMFENSGTIRISPEDYAKRHPDGSCDLLLFPTTSSAYRFNPFAMDGINIRVTTQGIDFCESP